MTIVLCGYARHYKIVIGPCYFEVFPCWLNVTVYYNSNSKAAAEFFANQLMPVWRKFINYIGVELIPFGNSTLIETPIDPYHNRYNFEFTSEFGPVDCINNKLHACILKYPIELLKTAKTQSELKKKITNTQLIMITCLMSYDNQLDSLKKCSYEYDSTEINQLKECVRTSEGDYYLAENGRRTSKFFPHIREFPFISMNNSNRIQFSRRALEDLEYVICAHMPKLCRRLMTTVPTPTPEPLTGHWFIT